MTAMLLSNILRTGSFFYTGTFLAAVCFAYSKSRGETNAIGFYRGVTIKTQSFLVSHSYTQKHQSLISVQFPFKQTKPGRSLAFLSLWMTRLS